MPALRPPGARRPGRLAVINPSFADGLSPPGDGWTEVNGTAAFVYAAPLDPVAPLLALAVPLATIFGWAGRPAWKAGSARTGR